MKTKIQTASAGFTLIELCVILGAISILASIAVPHFQYYVARAKQTEAKTALAGLASAENAFYAEYGFYSGDFRDIGLTLTGHPMNYNVGFAGAGWAPVGYTGSISGGCPARSAVNTDVSPCAVSPGSLAADVAFQPAPANGSCGAGADPSGGAFRATAIGEIAGDSTDIWSLDEKGLLCNNSPGLMGNLAGNGGNGGGGGGNNFMAVPNGP